MFDELRRLADRHAELSADRARLEAGALRAELEGGRSRMADLESELDRAQARGARLEAGHCGRQPHGRRVEPAGGRPVRPAHRVDQRESRGAEGARRRAPPAVVAPADRTLILLVSRPCCRTVADPRRTRTIRGTAPTATRSAPEHGSRQDRNGFTQYKVLYVCNWRPRSSPSRSISPNDWLTKPFPFGARLSFLWRMKP
jgi:hypothetical protein